MGSGESMRCRELESYIGWRPADSEVLRAAWPIVTAQVPVWLEDFYQTVAEHPETARVITGGAPQVERLKRSLSEWIRQLFLGPHDAEYAEARRRIGKRHVEIGVPQAFTHAAHSRLREAIRSWIESQWTEPATRRQLTAAIAKRMDLDLALMEDTYQAENLARAQPIHESRLRQQRAIVELGQRALSASRFEALIGFATALAADVFHADHVCVCEPDVAGSRSVPRIRAGTATTGQVLPGDSLQLANLAKRCAQEGVVTVSDDGRATESHAPGGPASRSNEISAACAPIRGEHGVWGVLLVSSHRPRPFVATDQDCLQAMANLISSSLQRFQAEDRIRGSERLAGIGQMITGLAHESRNALQRIQACAEMLRLELPTDSTCLPLIARIDKALDDLNHLFEEVRSYAAPVRLAWQPIDLGALARRIWSDVTHVHPGRRLRLECRLPENRIPLHGDSYRLGQVFRNLFENSVAACADPVAVEVTAEEMDLGPRRGVRIRVKDHGPGFSNRDVSRVFEPFFTTKAKGTGLGLAICRRIIEAHGGSIEVEPQEEAGAQILIQLPLEIPAEWGD